MYTEIPIPFYVVEKMPVDGKTICQTLEQAQEQAYDGYSCYVKDLKKFLQFIEVDGQLQIKEDSTYQHPDSHPATMIEQDASHRFVSDTEKANWNSKAAGSHTHSDATTEASGMMSAPDKQKLNGVAENANNYQHPAKHSPSIIEQDSANRFVSDTEKQGWNDKYTRSEIDNRITSIHEEIDWKEAVNTFEDIATTYPNPEHGWTVYVKVLNKKYTFNGTEWVNTSGGEIPLATSSTDGLMSAPDKQKLNGVAENANNYQHPAKHSPSIIEQDASHRFVSDTEKDEWNSKAAGSHTHSDATTEASGMMSAPDKQKLNGIAVNANNYQHPAKHSPSIITQDSNNRFVRDSEKAKWNRVAVTSFFEANANLGLTITLDVAVKGFCAKITLSGNGSLINITNAINGDSGIIIIVQNITGHYDIDFPANSLKLDGFYIAQEPNSVTVISWVYDGTNFYLSSGEYA